MDGVYIVEPFFSNDERGSFIKTYDYELYKKNGVDFKVIETCQSISKRGVLRGLHFQSQNSQSKLVRCVSGSIFDVIVDLRADSKTFAQWRGFNLSGENRKALFIPENFAHGFLVLTDDAIVSYDFGSRYDRDSDTGILWNDMDIGIEWPKLDVEYIISDRDKKLSSFKHIIDIKGD